MPCRQTMNSRLKIVSIVHIIRALLLLDTIFSSHAVRLGNFTFLLVLNQIKAATKIIPKIMLYIIDRE
mgnify:CR=1 FL=1